MSVPISVWLPQMSLVRQVLSDSSSVDISFAGGLPDNDLIVKHLLPVIEEVTKGMFADYKAAAPYFNYGPTSGLDELRDEIAEIETGRLGRLIKRENILITSGSQQGIEMATQLYGTGNKICVELPTYLGATPAFQFYTQFPGGKILTVPIDDNGLQISELEKLLDTEEARDLRMLYVIPSGHNPAGVRLAEDRRQKIAKLAEKHNFMVVEDDPYYGTGYSPWKNIISYDENMEYVLLLRSFSKELVNLRVGYIVAAPSVLEKLASLKSFKDLFTSLFDQKIILGVIRKMKKTYGTYSNYLESVVAKHYESKRTYMGETLQESFGGIDGVKWNTPKEGLFYWIEFPEGTDTMKLFQHAKEKYRIAFVPGIGFDAIAKDGVSAISNKARLSYSSPSIEQIKEGVGRLRQAYADLYGVK